MPAVATRAKAARLGEAQVREVARAALAAIAATDRGHVEASRRGMVAFVRLTADCLPVRTSVGFRRVNGLVWMEAWVWPQREAVRVQHYRLPADLQSAAAAMLDAL